MDRTRHKVAGKVIRLIDLPAAAVHPVLREGYAGADPRSDILSGLVAGVVALLLAMPLIIGLGLPPQHGLCTAIVACLVVAALADAARRSAFTAPA